MAIGEMARVAGGVAVAVLLFCVALVLLGLPVIEALR